MARLEYPAPAPTAFHTNFGPSSGHVSSNPVSGEFAVRAAPRNVGQLFSSKLSTAGARPATAKNAATKDDARQIRSARDSMGDSIAGATIEAGRAKNGALIGGRGGTD